MLGDIDRYSLRLSGVVRLPCDVCSLILERVARVAAARARVVVEVSKTGLIAMDDHDVERAILVEVGDIEAA